MFRGYFIKADIPPGCYDIDQIISYFQSKTRPGKETFILEKKISFSIEPGTVANFGRISRILTIDETSHGSHKVVVQKSGYEEILDNCMELASDSAWWERPIINLEVHPESSMKRG